MSELFGAAFSQKAALEFQHSIAEKNLVILNTMIGHENMSRVIKERLTKDLQVSLIEIFKSLTDE